MKFIILLALVVSCTHKDHKGTSKTELPPVETSQSAGESEAKPVSPYTVKPCFCMKIFRPVCADGKPYGNSCEAECHGHKTWTEGPCIKKR